MEIMLKIYGYIIIHPDLILSWTGAIISFVSGIFVFIFQTKYKSKIEHDFSITLEQKKSEFQKSLHDYGNFVEKRNEYYREIYEFAQKTLGAFPCISGPVNYPIFDDNKNCNLELLKNYFPDSNLLFDATKDNSYNYWIKNYIRNSLIDRGYNNFRLLNCLYFSTEIENITLEIYKNFINLENYTYSYLKSGLDFDKYSENYSELIKLIDNLKNKIKFEIISKV